VVVRSAVALGGNSTQTNLPKVIGGFELVAKLGQGGMGAVFQARQVSMDRLVALKVLPPALARNRNYIERFQREARASVLIAHPNLVQGVDAGQDADSGLWYFAMEFVPGETLRTVMRRDGKFAEQRALTIARDVAAGLAAAHHAGMVHRDIKPDNVMITPDGSAKILDLGLAKHEDDDSELTQTGASIGTPLYMAPEQARGDLDQLDATTDLYALGATLFHLIAGRPPFEGPTSAVILSQHLTAPAPALDQVAPGTSAATAALIARLLAKDQAKRPASGDVVVAAIEDILAGRTPALVRASGERRGRAATRSERHPAKARPPLLMVGAVLAGLAVIVGLGFALVGPTAPPPALASVTDVEPLVAATATVAAVPVPVPTAATADRHAELERALAHARAWVESNPDGYGEAIVRLRKVNDHAKGTPAEAEFAERVALAVAAVEARRATAAAIAWTDIEARVRAAAAAQRFDQALILADAVPPALAPALTARQAALVTAVRAQAQGVVDTVLAAAAAAAQVGDAATLAAAGERLATIAWAAGVMAAQPTLTKLRSDLDQAEATRRDASAAAWATLSGTLVADLIAGSAKAVVDRVATARRDRGADRVALDRVDAVLAAAEVRAKALPEAINRQRGKPVDLLTTQRRGSVQGVVEEVTAKGVRLTLDLGNGNRAGLTVPLDEIHPKDAERLIATVWTAQSADDRVLAALAALRADASTANAAIDAIGAHPLVDALRAHQRVLAVGPAEANAEKAWAALVEAGKRPCRTPEQGRALAVLIDAFARAHASTKVASAHAAEIGALGVRAASAQSTVPPGSTYLADLVETSAEVFGGKLLRGVGGDGKPVVVAGVAVPKSLWAHPVASGAQSRIAFQLPAGAQALAGRCAVLFACGSPQTFVILGDGRELWRSQPVALPEVVQAYQVPVVGVRALELRVECPGSHSAAWAVWCDPAIVASVSVVTAVSAPVVPPPFVPAPDQQLVLWNQHNGAYNDRGTLAVDINFLRGETVVGSLVDRELPWRASTDQSATFPVPRERFDRIRVAIKRWQGMGGGLAEVQLFRQGTNVLVGARARASGVYRQALAAECVTDGITTAATQAGIWLLPDQVAGWIDVDLP